MKTCSMWCFSTSAGSSAMEPSTGRSAAGAAVRLVLDVADRLDAGPVDRAERPHRPAREPAGADDRARGSGSRRVRAAGAPPIQVARRAATIADAAHRHEHHHRQPRLVLRLPGEARRHHGQRHAGRRPSRPRRVPRGSGAAGEPRTSPRARNATSRPGARAGSAAEIQHEVGTPGRTGSARSRSEASTSRATRAR